MILIKKDPNSEENLNYRYEDYNRLVNSVNLLDIILFISRSKRNSYFYVNENGYLSRNSLFWAIFSYLIINSLLIIENRLYISEYESNPDHSPREVSRRSEKFIKFDSYFYPLEGFLYSPILSKLVKNEFLFKNNYDSYSINISTIRDYKLSTLINDK